LFRTLDRGAETVFRIELRCCLAIANLNFSCNPRERVRDGATENRSAHSPALRHRHQETSGGANFESRSSYGTWNVTLLESVPLGVTT